MTRSTTYEITVSLSENRSTIERQFLRIKRPRSTDMSLPQVVEQFKQLIDSISPEIAEEPIDPEWIRAAEDKGE